MFIKIDKATIDESLEVCKAPFVRNHDEARILLLVALDREHSFHTRNLCGIIGTLIVAHGWERAVGFLAAAWYFNGNNEYREGIEIVCHVLGIDLDDPLFTVNM